MSTYLGFKPSDDPVFCFISYNSDDAERIKDIVKVMSESGINVWYDHGIEIGEKWEEVIVEKLQKAQAVILFLTKAVLKKEDPYARKEYKWAKEHFKKKVITIFMDDITLSDVPVKMIPWWDDIMETQILKKKDFPDINSMVSVVASALGINPKKKAG